jgi:hypothetical protein
MFLVNGCICVGRESGNLMLHEKNDMNMKITGRI